MNQRDLRSFEVDTDRAERVRAAMPAGTASVAESGIRTRGDLERLAAAGFDAALVGESLVTAPDPAAALRSLRGLGASGAGDGDGAVAGAGEAAAPAPAGVGR